MTIPTTGLTGPFLAFANAVNRWINGLRSVACLEVATPADLPNAQANNRRVFVVSDAGAGSPGLAFSQGGSWWVIEGSPV